MQKEFYSCAQKFDSQPSTLKPAAVVSKALKKAATHGLKTRRNCCGDIFFFLD